jgi:hypothetical protein
MYLIDITVLIEILININVHEITRLIEKKVLVNVVIDILERIVKIHQYQQVVLLENI